MSHRSVLIRVVALGLLALGAVACASGSTTQQPAAAVSPEKLAGTWRGFGRVYDTNGPIEIKIANDGSFTGTAGGAVVSGKLKLADGAVTFDSVGPKQGATGNLIYSESGGKATLRGSGEGKYAGS